MPSVTESPIPASPLFDLGEICCTPGALALLKQHNLHPIRFIARHLHGDWGDLDAEDVAANRQALIHHARLLSAYPLPNGERLWVITEADRRVTTLLRPDEY